MLAHKCKSTGESCKCSYSDECFGNTCASPAADCCIYQCIVMPCDPVDKIKFSMLNIKLGAKPSCHVVTAMTHYSILHVDPSASGDSKWFETMWVAAVLSVGQCREGKQATDVSTICLQEDIEKAKKGLERRLEDARRRADSSQHQSFLHGCVKPMALYGQQDPKQVDAAICKGKPTERRVIFCTNVAETSLTIDGVTVVVDAGFNKEAVYDHQKHMTILQVCNSTVASCSVWSVYTLLPFSLQRPNNWVIPASVFCSHC